MGPSGTHKIEIMAFCIDIGWSARAAFTFIQFPAGRVSGTKLKTNHYKNKRSNNFGSGFFACSVLKHFDDSCKWFCVRGQENYKTKTERTTEENPTAIISSKLNDGQMHFVAHPHRQPPPCGRYEFERKDLWITY